MRGAVTGALAVAVLAVLVAAWDLPRAVAHDGAHCSGNATTPTPPWDMDCDSVRDEIDNCKPRQLNDFAMRNPDQIDSDADMRGNKCDEDDDGDGVPDGPDNCNTVANPNQEDTSVPPDGIGDACAVDNDDDGIVDPRDNCPPRFDTDHSTANPDQLDTDADGFGNVCDSDDDEDYIPDRSDNCPLEWNQDQVDADGDGRGAACDPGDAPPTVAPPGTTRPPKDLTAPTLRLGVARTLRLRELGNSIAVKVRCSEGCTVQAQLVVKRRKMAAGTAALADHGTTYVFMRFASAKLRRLAPARAALTLTAVDGAGNARAMTRALRLRR